MPSFDHAFEEGSRKVPSRRRTPTREACGPMIIAADNHAAGAATVVRRFAFRLRTFSRRRNREARDAARKVRCPHQTIRSLAQEPPRPGSRKLQVERRIPSNEQPSHQLDFSRRGGRGHTRVRNHPARSEAAQGEKGAAPGGHSNAAGGRFGTGPLICADGR